MPALTSRSSSCRDRSSKAARFWSMSGFLRRELRLDPVRVISRRFFSTDEAVLQLGDLPLLLLHGFGDQSVLEQRLVGSSFDVERCLSSWIRSSRRWTPA